MNVLESIVDLRLNDTVEDFAHGLNYVEDVFFKLYDEIERLEKSKLIYGKLHFRKDATGKPKYCYVIHSTKGKSTGSNKRERDYLGVDEDKIKEAIEAISRAQRLEFLKTEASRLERNYYELYKDIMDLKRSFVSFKINNQPVDK